MNKRVLVLGGDGFVGWPTALRLSQQGHDVAIMDNGSRRTLGAPSVLPVQTLQIRVSAWKQLTGKTIQVFANSVLDASKLEHAIVAFKPTTVCHFAHQRSAPFSMLDDKSKRYTIENNTQGTLNVLLAISTIDPTIHLVHMGTMGVYGYNGADRLIPEGYLRVFDEHGNEAEIVHPYHPGSVYHLSKCMINTMFHFWTKNNGLKITELNQGIIWGTQTPETRMHANLSNRVDADGEYGTVLNRFVAQCAQRVPMTVYGSGQQTRAFIHIDDSVRCTMLAIQNPPNRGDRVQTYNQATQCARLIDIASMMQTINTESTIEFMENPRNELSANDLRVEGTVEFPGKFALLQLQGQKLIDCAQLRMLQQELNNVDLSNIDIKSKAVW